MGKDREEHISICSTCGVRGRENLYANKMLLIVSQHKESEELTYFRSSELDVSWPVIISAPLNPHWGSRYDDIKTRNANIWSCLVIAASSPQTENDLWEVWNKTGHQGNKWNRAEIPLRKLRNFEVIFEGIRSWDVSGGAALDDLEYIDCAPSRWYAR